MPRTAIKPIAYCRRCVYPMIAVNLHMDDEGVCSSCRSYEKFEAVPAEVWSRRGRKFEEIVEETRKRNRSHYDCIVCVSGGKAATFKHTSSRPNSTSSPSW